MYIEKNLSAEIFIARILKEARNKKHLTDLNDEERNLYRLCKLLVDINLNHLQKFESNTKKV